MIILWIQVFTLSIGQKDAHNAMEIAISKNLHLVMYVNVLTKYATFQLQSVVRSKDPASVFWITESRIGKKKVKGQRKKRGTKISSRERRESEWKKK